MPARTLICSAFQGGKIAEHWDSVAKDPAALHFNPNTDSKPDAVSKPKP